MRVTSILKLLNFVLLLLCFVNIPSSGARTITYQADSTTDFPNPERGFFCQTNWDSLYFNVERLQRVRRDSNITVIRVYYRMDSFVNTDILPRSFLDKVLHDGDTLRQGGAKIIPRFIYNGGGSNALGRNCSEPPLPRMLSHINQLAPVLRANSDVIAYLEAGFIGFFGEWHHFRCYPNDPYLLDNTANRRTVLFRILDSLPGCMVALRYNFHKRAIFGTNAPLGPDSAFSGSRRARTGAINDAFASNADNMGTYQPAIADTIEAQKAFLSLDNRYVPQGGEPEYPQDSSTARCGSAMIDLKRMHWDILNNYYHPSTHSLWQNSGCRVEIRKKIGYRIELLNAVLQDSVRPGSLFTAIIRLRNTGSGKIFNPRGCELVFRNTSSQKKYPVKLGIDPRRWCMTDSAVSVTMNAPIPVTIPTGFYKVYLNLPDTAQRLHGTKEYSIRLANTNIWEDSTGYNSLLHNVYISPDVSIISRPEAPQLPLFKLLNITRQGDAVTFAFNSATIAPFSLEIYALSGSKIWSRTISQVTPGTRNVISVKLPTGVYLLKTTTKDYRPSGVVRLVEVQRFFR